jgi:hypothetical protein
LRWSWAHVEARPLCAALALTLLSTGSACSTSYQPRPSGRIGLVIHNGAAMYVEDGRQIPIGPLGGALKPLVASSSLAAASADRAHTELAVGVPLYVGGVATLVVGLALSWSPVGWLVLGLGVASGGTGLGLMGAGVTNAVDAVNLHNDAVSATPVSR